MFALREHISEESEFLSLSHSLETRFCRLQISSQFRLGGRRRRGETDAAAFGSGGPAAINRPPAKTEARRASVRRELMKQYTPPPPPPFCSPENQPPIVSDTGQINK